MTCCDDSESLVKVMATTKKPIVKQPTIPLGSVIKYNQEVTRKAIKAIRHAITLWWNELIKSLSEDPEKWSNDIENIRECIRKGYKAYTLLTYKLGDTDFDYPLPKGVALEDFVRYASEDYAPTKLITNENSFFRECTILLQDDRRYREDVEIIVNVFPFEKFAYSCGSQGCCPLNTLNF
jgi:hypothetical protein